MRILLTGASSFTGMWFARALTDAGHAVTATFRGASVAAYSDETRRHRVDMVTRRCEPIFDCEFGDERFMDVIRNGGPFDVLCHHAADATNYKSTDFDAAAALSSNTANLRTVLAVLDSTGCSRVALTGSVFEGGEGAGSDGLPHFSPYGVSKAMTAEVFRFHAAAARFRLGKFVVSNPFGPYEEPRFTAYLTRTWYARQTPVVKTPAYVRDNIHVSLLAKSYARFVGALSPNAGFEKHGPSGYIESQLSFARRFAHEMSGRLQLECPVAEALQTEFEEPRIRINTDAVNAVDLGWDEAAAWDDVADYYREKLGPTRA